MVKSRLNSKAVIGICKKYKVSTLSHFGSRARDEGRPDSDLDLLVTFSKQISFLQLVALERELAQALGQKVDLLTENSLSPYLRDRILAERQLVYAA